MKGNLIRWSPVILGMLSMLPTGILAETAIPDTELMLNRLEQINRYSQEGQGDTEDALGQVTSISQLSDVQPTDWAFQALQSLVERYGCIAGYPDGTYRGQRAMTRYEFAAGLNACLDRINELISAATGDLASREDFATVQRLQEEFAAELSVLRGRVDALEARTAELEANQFSTTTKLEGVVVMAMADAWGNKREVDAQTIFAQRTRLELNTSFSGRDLLFTRLQISGINTFSANVTPSPEGDLFFASGPYGEGGNTVELDALKYEFPIGEKISGVLVANAGATDDFAPTINPFFDGDGNLGSVSTFGTRPSINYYLDGAGAGFAYQLNDSIALNVGYLASDAGSPERGSGLFNGPYGLLGQLTLTPSDRLQMGLTYIHSYNNPIGTGSNAANIADPEGLSRRTGIDDILKTVNNSYGFAANWLVSDRLALGGWVGYTAQRSLNSPSGLRRGDQKIWNWAVTLGFPDLFQEGNLGGIIVGMEPKVTEASGGLPKDRDTSLHLEAFYQWQINDFITITPAVIWITKPDHNDRNSDLVIGTVRTTFSF